MAGVESPAVHRPVRPNVDSRGGAFVARQPILDEAGRLFGYELLYRAGTSATACTEDRDQAAARVFTDALLHLGLDTLTGGRRAFVNVTRQILLDGAVTLLPPSAVVVEVLEDVVADADVVAACQQLRSRGYPIALDDFRQGGPTERLLPFAQYVKVDVLQTPREERRLLERTLRHTVTLVAEKVETIEAYDEAKAAGHRLFQGHYFARPTTFAGATISPRRLAYTRLLAALNAPGVTVNAVEELIKADAALTYRVLRSVNSAAFAVQREVQSIRQALVMLGLEPIRKWASVWALAGIGASTNPELVSMATLRARCCEHLAGDAYGSQASPEAFLLGLCSLLDALLKVPIAQAVKDLPVPARVRDALLGQANDLRAILDAVLAYEDGRWDEATA